MSQRIPTRASAAAAGASRQRQRLRLIDACISALHRYGPSRTTVEKVVALAGLSPGIVRFYFASKAAMLVASLEYLAGEFEARVLVPVRRLEHAPAQALRLLVELYVDSDIASPRKVSVWYSFWGEASSRQEYYDICGRRDEEFAALVRALMRRMVHGSGAAHLDADAVALGLIGVLEMHWQDFAFRNESDIDRAAATAMSLAYLRSIFPRQFAHRGRNGGGRRARAAVPARRASLGAAADTKDRLPAWAYADEALLALERERLLRPTWQLGGHKGQLRRAGDYFTVELAGERIAVLLGGGGKVRALRNACPQRPHALLLQPHGHTGRHLECTVHGLTWSLDGHAAARRGADLARFGVAIHGSVVLVRAQQDDGEVAPPPDGNAWAIPSGPQRAHISTLEVAADWKLVVEQWLERPDSARHFLPPNQLLLHWRGGVSFLQVLPVARGRSRIRRLDLVARRAAGATGTAPAPRRPPARRACEQWLLGQIALAESIQGALEGGAAQVDAGAAGTRELRSFRAGIAALLPAAGAAG
ncbi:MAG: TetR family transcriptional regulator C-terminal domain-containing protein [Proteobacteria bacterium]|nr:TetR family transcriptional regulator C-terminal domain-containing protein [Pseudomonadota bacterium]